MYLVLASAPNKDTVGILDKLEKYNFKSNDMSASPKPVSSEDILGQKVSILY